jgi:hypothetical protein
MTYVDQLIRAVHDSCRHNTPQHIYHCADVDAARRIVESAWADIADPDEYDTDYCDDGNAATVHAWTQDSQLSIKIHLHRGGRDAAL